MEGCSWVEMQLGQASAATSKYSPEGQRTIVDSGVSGVWGRGLRCKGAPTCMGLEWGWLQPQSP